MNTQSIRWWSVLLLCLVFMAGDVAAKNPRAKQAGEEMEFGYKAARRGYWQEALERFELADELTPNQPRILNNIAVALEANGRFDEARTTYEVALSLDPNNQALRKNLRRFEEFYTTFISLDEDDDSETSEDDEDGGAGSGDDEKERGEDGGAEP